MTDKVDYEVDNQVEQEIKNLNSALIGTPQFWLVMILLIVIAVGVVVILEHVKKNKNDEDDVENQELQNEKQNEKQNEQWIQHIQRF